MDTRTKLAVLTIIYSIYEDFISAVDVACEKYCARCCTRNVTMTTLEGVMILDHMVRCGKTDLIGRIKASLPQKRFVPLMTINRLADLCVQGKDFPDEESDVERGICPLLADKECTIYKVRPFGCRCMVSKINCRESGYADMDPFVITVNNLFLQTIEHIDADGCSGNLSDILLFLESEDNRKKYQETGSVGTEAKLIPNHPATVLMIPPEHRTRIQPVLKSLRNITVPNS